MKKLIAIKIFVAVLLLNGCATIQLTDPTITALVSFGTLEGLKYGIKDSTRRAVVANYIDVYASALRSVAGSPTPDSLVSILNQFIPENVRADATELEALVIPVITSVYSQAYAKFGANNPKIYQVLNDIAFGLESGAAPYITKS